MKEERKKSLIGFIEYCLIDEPLSLDEIKIDITYEDKFKDITKSQVESTLNVLINKDIVRKVSFGGVVKFGLTPAEDYLIAEEVKK